MLRRVRPEQTDRRVPTRAAVVGLALAAGLTACGGSGDGQEQKAAQSSSKALQAVQAAYGTTTGADSVQISLTGKQVGGKQKNKSSTVTGTAKLSFADKASARTIDSPGATPTSKSREIDGILYQKVPEKQRKQVPGKKPWVKIDLGKVAKALGQPADKQPPTDPANILSYLHGATKASTAGTSTIDGTGTTRYNVTVNLGQIAKGQSSQAAQRAQQLMKQLGKPMMPMQVWLDDQNRVRRLKTEVTSGGGQQAQQGGQARQTTVVTTEDFHSYNDSVDISAPPKSDTANMTKQVIKRQQMQAQMQQQMQQRRQQQMQQQLQKKLQQQQQQKQQQGQSGQQ